MNAIRCFLFLLLVPAFHSKAQAIKTANQFEGKITYKIEYSAKNNFDVSNFSTLYGDTAELFYSKGNFRFDFNGTETKRHVYRVDSNQRMMLVNQKGIEKTITTDLTKPVSYLVEINHGESKKLLLTQAYGNGSTSRSDFRFDSDQLMIDPSVFRRWHYNHLNTVFAFSKSLWTEHRIETDEYVIHWKAIDIKARTIDNKLFLLKQ
ncbi:MAG: hypothetical protein J0L67_20960 [Cytophagales bacterium]|nr:hypothetical protein [Cytophagales bacterium]